LRALKILVALTMIGLMVVLAKAAQYAAVDAFGDQIGFNLASLLGAGPVIAIYFFLSVRFPRLNKFGLTRG